jgi:hypothetical protein
MGCSSSNKEIPKEKEDSKSIEKKVIIKTNEQNILNEIQTHVDNNAFNEYSDFLNDKRKVKVNCTSLSVFKAKQFFQQNFVDDVVLDQIRQSVLNNDMKYFQSFVDNYKDILSKSKIKHEMILKEILNPVCEEFIEREIKIINWKTHDILKSIAQVIFPKEFEESVDKLIRLYELLDNIKSLFPPTQTGYFYSVPNCNDELVSLINSNLKSNENYIMNKLLNLHLSTINNNENIYKEISDIIESNLLLNTIIIFIKFENINDINKETELIKFSEFSKVLQSIRKHKSIKNVVLNLEGSHYRFTQNIDSMLIDLISDDKIISFSIIGYPFDYLILEEFLSGLCKNEKIMFIAIDLNFDFSNSLNVMANHFSKHPSLKFILLSGGNLNMDDCVLIKNSLSEKKIFHYTYDIKKLDSFN